MEWPNQASFTCVLTIDVDGDLPLLAEDSANLDREKTRSAGLYGPEHGAPRLLRMLTAEGFGAHRFFPGEMARRYPGLVAEVVAAGHGVGVHGNRHIDFSRIGLDEQIAEMTDGRDTVASAAGVQPTGFRIPAAEWAQGFPEAMSGAGFRWSSSLPSDDMPFFLTGSGLVEIPFRYELEDQQYLGYNLDPPFPPGQSRITPLSLVEANWMHEVAGAQRFGTLLHLRLNAEVMGFPGRVVMLRRFLTGLRDRGDVWFTSMDELCAWQAAQEPDPAHPYALFTGLVEERI